MEPGTLFADRFRVERLAGRGGMGSVFHAFDQVLGREVALKLVGPLQSVDPARFTREALVLAELRHPAIVEYVAHGTTAAGEQWLALEWLEGEDLATRLARKGLEHHETLALARRIAAALAFAHAHGVVHRDIKPQNLMLVGGEPRQAKLLDFGIARAGGSTLTQPGSVFGTPGFMAPEQARGERELGPAVDVFALGAVLFECWTGKPAFEGESAMVVLAKILMSDAPRLGALRPDAPAELEELVARMLERDAARRLPDASAVLSELERLGASGAGPMAAPPSRRPVLTTREQRYASIALVARPVTRADPDAQTMALASARDDCDVEGLRAATAAVGSRLELVLGSMLVLVGEGATPSEKARRAAQGARIARAALPEARVAVATGRREADASAVVGEVILRAERLLERGEPPRVAIDELTASLLGSWLELERDEQGYLLPVGEPRASPARPVAGRATRLVGRARELALLEATLDQAIEERSARVVVMTAAPGVGKSRLKEELVRRARARGSVCVWQADCDPVTTGAPFSVASALVRSALELPPGLPPEALRAHARGKLDALQASPSERASAEAFLLELAGASQDDERVRVAREGRGVLGEQLERAFGDLLAWQLSSGPLLVIVDDLQWGDLTSVRLIDLSLASQAESPLVVLVLARPELEQVFPRLFSARAPLHYALAELTRAASEALARDVLGERATPELVRTLVERAAGNAFFLEELLRAAATGGDEAPPETVLAMLDARVSALDPEARRVLRAASLFGVVFPEDGVVAALGGAARAESTRAWLGELEAREILARAPERAGPSALAFRHALVREAVYGTLLDDDRRLGHRLAAEWLEASSDAPDARVLARHWQLAGERARAAAAFVRAAGHALDANDPTAVIELASAARACGAEGPLLARAWVLEGTAYGFRGELDTAVSAAREAMALAPEGSPDWLDAVRAYLLGERHFDGTGARLDLEALAREVEPFLATDPTRAALVLADVAHRLVTRIELEAADQLLTRLRALADGAAATPSSLGAVAVARISQVSSARRLAAGDLAGHLVERERARALFSEVGALRDALEAQSAVAYGHTLVGHYEEAEQAIRRAEREARRLGLEHLRHVNVHNLGLVVLRLGRPDECIALEAEARAWLEQAHDSRLAGTCMHYAALAHVEKGELDQAEALYRAYLDTHAHYPGNRAEALAGLAWVLARRGDGEGARGPASEAVRIVDELGGIDEAEPFIRLAHVEALFAAGAASEAREALALAHDKLEAALLAITDPAMRATCAARVPEHARLRELAREHLGDVPRRAAVLYHEV